MIENELAHRRYLCCGSAWASQAAKKPCRRRTIKADRIRLDNIDLSRLCIDIIATTPEQEHALRQGLAQRPPCYASGATASGSSRTAPSLPRTAASPLPDRRRTCPPAGMRASGSIARAAGSRPGSSIATRISSIGGDRAHEFELRLKGASYEEIARAGGGIVSTVKATRAASEDDLVASALPRLDHLIAEGCTTIEIKSGYGLDLETEARILARRAPPRRASVPSPSPPPSSAPMPCRRRRTATRMPSSTRSAARCCRLSPAKASPMRSTPSARASPSRPSRRRACSMPRRRLGLHDQAPCRPALQPARREARRRLRRALGRSSRIHGRGRRRRHGEGRHRRRAAAGRLLHAARDASCRRSPPSAQHGTRMALATDCNPGTSPLTSLLLTMNMGATLFRMTVEECIAGVTREAARALGSARRDRHAGTRQVLRSRDLEHRAPGGARLPHRLQPASRPHLERTVTQTVTLHPGSVALADWAPGLFRRTRSRSIRIAAPPSRPAPGPSRPSSPRASRSTASTPASESSRACASAPPISRRSSATSCSRMPPASASRCRSPSCAS